jgi:hypothetical protein
VDIGVTAEQVRLLAILVDAQITSLSQDASVAASKGDWDLKVGTAFLQFVASWKTEFAQAQANGWLTFGLGAEYDRIKSYQESARDWQKRIAQISGIPSSIPEIRPPGTAIPWVPLAIVAGVAGAFYFGLPQRLARAWR